MQPLPWTSSLISPSAARSTSILLAAAGPTLGPDTGPRAQRPRPGGLTPPVTILIATAMRRWAAASAGAWQAARRNDVIPTQFHFTVHDHPKKLRRGEKCAGWCSAAPLRKSVTISGTSSRFGVGLAGSTVAPGVAVSVGRRVACRPGRSCGRCRGWTARLVSGARCGRVAWSLRA
jgi:hypothetical protein